MPDQTDVVMRDQTVPEPPFYDEILDDQRTMDEYIDAYDAVDGRVMCEYDQHQLQAVLYDALHEIKAHLCAAYEVRRSIGTSRRGLIRDYVKRNRVKLKTYYKAD